MLLNYIEQVVSTGFIFFNLVIISLQFAVDEHHPKTYEVPNKVCLCSYLQSRSATFMA
jgi:hypothetical protein